MAEKKKRGLLSKLGFKSKEDKLAIEAAEKAAAQQLVDEQMAARMAAINAAALKSAREQDESAAGASQDELARIEAEEKRRADIQAAKDVARAKQLAEEKTRKEQAAAEAAQKTADDKIAAEAKAARIAEDAAALKAKQDADALAAKEQAEAARKAEDARIKAEQAAALAQAKSDADAAALKAKQEAEALALAKAREAADAKAQAEAIAEQQRIEDARIAAETAEAQRVAAAQAAAEKAEAKRLKEEALEADRRAKIAEEHAARDIAERQLAQEKEAAKAAEIAAANPTPETDTLAEGNFLGRITAGLRKSTTRMTDQVSAVFKQRKLDDTAIEELEDILIASDLGIGPASKVTALLAKDKFDKQVTDMEVKIALADVISDILTPLEKPIILGLAKPQILLFVGVNGSGKTTTLGKIAKRYTDEGKKVLIAAGDTFRAAAVEQLTVWGKRSGAPVMSADTGADAAGLVFDAITRAREENYDILMIDTAGRLQNRTELMDELSKIIRVIQKQDPSAPHHSILVLDATVGQNALIQTEAFKETAGVTGLIMTKLDGTAKGGVLVALSDKYALPIHHIGIGERIEDLENFSAPVFAAALSGVSDAMG